jgi:hypothetical protein
MRATANRPHARLMTVNQAEREYGLPAALIRDLIHRGDLAAVQPPNIRRVFVVRADLERKLEAWRVQRAL